MHVCPQVTVLVPHVGGPILPPCVPTVLIDMMPAATVTCMALCVGPPDVIVMGSTGVMIGMMPAARIGDLTAHGGTIILGSPTCIIGETGSPSPGMAGLVSIAAGLTLAGVSVKSVSNPLAATNPGGAAPAAGGATTPVSPCSGKGMEKPENEKEFADGMKKLKKDWKTLTAAQRKDQMEKLINDQLAKSGVPKVPVVNDPNLDKDTDGQFDFPTGNMDLNPNQTSSNDLTDAQAKDLGDTLYHESRHAEQWFLMARSEAAKGKKAEQIAHDLGIPLDNAKAAVANPLPDNDPMKNCAEAMYDSVYGKDSAHRDKVLTDMPKLSKAVDDAKANQKKVNDNPASTAADKKAAQDAVNAAEKANNDNYDAYRALPEEADAWNAGSQAGDLIAK
jgi:uncharacterized Zn-binding protein involved in type VI secretion